MEDIKLNFYKRFIFPALEPVFDYFSKFGISPITVIGVPSLVVVILSLRGVKKKSYDFYVRIIGIILMIIAIMSYQMDFHY